MHEKGVLYSRICFKVLLLARLRNDVHKLSELTVAKIVKAPGISREDLKGELYIKIT